MQYTCFSSLKGKPSFKVLFEQMKDVFCTLAGFTLHFKRKITENQHPDFAVCDPHVRSRTRMKTSHVDT